MHLIACIEDPQLIRTIPGLSPNIARRRRNFTRGLAHVGTYKAWLSDADTDARDRFEHDGPRYRADGFQIAADLADLTDGSLTTTNNISDFGTRLILGVGWTGTKADGTKADVNSGSGRCDSWTSTEAKVLTGDITSSANEWTSWLGRPCSQSTFYLHCLSDFDPDQVFEDGFEAID